MYKRQPFIKADDDRQLRLALEDQKNDTNARAKCCSVEIIQNLSLQLLELACQYSSFGCINLMLQQIETFQDLQNLNCYKETIQNFLYNFICSLGMKQLEMSDEDAKHKLHQSTISVFDFIFERLSRREKDTLLVHNSKLLYYAVKYDLTDLVKNFRKWDENIPYLSKYQFNKHARDVYNPWTLALATKQIEAAKLLFSNLFVSPKFSVQECGLLAPIISLRSESLLKIIMNDTAFEVDRPERRSGETALHIACKYNSPEIVACLLAHGANSEVVENKLGWTPLFIAAAKGYNEVLQILLQYGCDVNLKDNAGWTAREYAIIEGHLSVAKLLSAKEKEHSRLNEELQPLPSRLDNVHGPAKMFNYNLSAHCESLLMLNMNNVFLNQFASSVSFKGEDTLEGIDIFQQRVLLRITCIDDIENESHTLNLPLNKTLGGIGFKVPYKKDNSYQIAFDICSPKPYQKNVAPEDVICGGAIVQLNQFYFPVGPNLFSLNRNISIPILQMDSSSTYETIGTIEFDATIIHPFNHPGTKHITERTKDYWESLLSTRVIGHRGFGMNRLEKRSLQLGENTMESFIAASTLGASFVEFDVQLTKDDVPVIYHDFTVAETGVDLPMHELTLEQFLELSNCDNKDNKNGNNDNNNNNNSKSAQEKSSLDNGKRRRSLASFDISGNMDEGRMKYTKTFKEKHFKGNSRGHSIASSFVTLKELFTKLPLNVGFNIECKYPMIDEFEQEGIATVMIEMNHWVDTLLEIVYDNMRSRNIIFSSFHPDICIMSVSYTHLDVYKRQIARCALGETLL